MFHDNVPALPSKFFALTDAAGLESRLLVAFQQQSLPVWRLHLFTRKAMTKLPIHLQQIFRYKNGYENLGEG